MITSASFQRNNVLIEPIKQDQRANEREACTELESKSFHFLILIRSRPAVPTCATIAGGVIPRASGNSFNESRGGVEGHAHSAALFGGTSNRRISRPSGYAPLHSVSLRRKAGIESCPRDLSLPSSQPFAMSGQPASDDFIVVARSFYNKGRHRGVSA